MGVTLDEAQIHKLYQLKDKGRTVPQIAKETGISESSVKRYLKARKRFAEGSESERKNEPSERIPSHARLKEGGSKQGQKNRVKNELVEAYAEEAEIDRRALASSSLEDLDAIMESCRKGLMRASGIDKESERSEAEARYLKIMKDIAIAKGKYGGLDNVPVTTVPTSPLDDLSRALVRFEEEDA